MTVFKKFKQISVKTKILLFSLLLIILPSSFLGYLGYNSIEGRELRLKENYTGLVRILRDQLEGSIRTSEENFIRDMMAFEWPLEVPSVQSELRQLQEQNPIISAIFLVDHKGSFIHPDVHLFSSSVVSFENTAVQALNSTQVSTGERYEFSENNYAQALRSYSRALEQESSLQVQTYIRMLMARCQFKMQNYALAVENYSRLVETEREVKSTDGTPMKIIGLSQLAECYSLLEDYEERCRTLLSLYNELISIPFGFNSYDFYLATVKEELSQLSQQADWDSSFKIQLENLNKEEARLLQTVRLLEKVQNTARNQIDSGSFFSREIIQDEDGSPLQVALLALPETISPASHWQLVYRIDKEYVLNNILLEIGSEANVGGNIRIGIFSSEESFHFPEETPDPELSLASEELVQFFPWWKLNLFDTKGKTVENIIKRERLMYAGALFGVFVLIMVGAALTLRAAIHETEAARIKSEFVSNVSHELKTPLALIRLFGETLEMEDIPDKKKRKKFSRIITRETQRLSQIVENVLDFSKIESGRKDYNFVEEDIVQVVSDTLEAYRYYLRDQEFEFVYSIPDKPLLMVIDKDAISQAMINLFSNAEKFSKEKKYIAVKMEQKGEEVWIEVEDKGPGIPEASLKHVFDRYDRGGGEMAREVQGSGLGLTIVKHIVDSHGGRIEVESKVDEGSCFILKLPLSGDRT